MDELTIILRTRQIAKNAIIRIKAVLSWLFRDGDEPCELWEIRLRKYQRSRTRAQNSLYWMWLTYIGVHVGYSKDELHAILAAEFLEPQFVKFRGTEYSIHPSTTSLKVGEFSEYLNRIERWAAENAGISLPHPDDLYIEAMGER